MPKESGILSPEQEAKKDVWLNELCEFIVEANLETYAADKGKVAPEDVESPDYKELEYKRGDWRLRDRYTGDFRAPGTTTVYYKGRTAWVMSYGGVGTEPGQYQSDDQMIDFLKAALKRITPDLPYRGPRKYQEGEFTYEMDVRGNPDEFDGSERIFKSGDIMFSQIFFGGIVIHSTPEGEPLYPWDL